MIEALKSKNPEVVHAVKFRRNYGKSPGLNCGFQRAKGDVVITMDADLQDSPDEIPELYRMITEDGYDLVSGLEEKALRPAVENHPDQAVQRYSTQILRHYEPARLQLRAEGLQKHRNQEHRNL